MSLLVSSHFDSALCINLLSKDFIGIALITRQDFKLTVRDLRFILVVRNSRFETYISRLTVRNLRLEIYGSRLMVRNLRMKTYSYCLLMVPVITVSFWATITAYPDQKVAIGLIVS